MKEKKKEFKRKISLTWISVRNIIPMAEYLGSSGGKDVVTSYFAAF